MHAHISVIYVQFNSVNTIPINKTLNKGLEISIKGSQLFLARLTVAYVWY
jgi:hypothetical protein